MIACISGSPSRLFICRNTQGYLLDTYREIGFTVYLTGLGKLAAIMAASVRVSREADFLKYFLDAA
jgi:hypothetical protein